VKKKTSESKIPRQICVEIAREIQKNGGNEVFFHARTDAHGTITEIEAVAWGNEFAAPALLNRLDAGDIVIHNHPSGELTPSLPDIQVASMLGNRGIGFYIVDNNADKLKIVVDRFTEKKRENLDIRQLGEELGENSKIAGNLPDYECRAGQISMAEETARDFNDGFIGLIEAGTGTGKSLAYLLPAIKWAVKNKERVLVSTKTINLQEQLVFKDIPFLKEALAEEFKAVLVKGRNNYACLRKIDAEERDLGLFKKEEIPGGFEELKSLISWSKKTKDGSLSDLNFVPKYEVWEKIQCDSETCTGIKCPFYEDCFLVAARREAAMADILIVNHHLLFADLSLRGSFGSLADVAVLPPYTRIIIDEAHHIEDVCTEHFGTMVSQAGIKRMLGRLLSHTRKSEPKGLLPFLRLKLKSVTSAQKQEAVNAVISLIDDELIPGKDEVTGTADDLFLDIEAFLQKKIKNAKDDRQHRLDHRFLDDREWGKLILVKAEGLINRTHEYKSALNRVLESVKDLGDAVRKNIENTVLELEATARKIGEMCDTLYYLLFEADESVVKWIELTEKHRSVRVCAAPIHVAEPLKKTLFTPFDTVIMTSATLTVGGTFDFIMSRLGVDQIENDRVRSIMFPSPFDFQRQALIGIPMNNHPPDHPLFSKTAHDNIARSLGISSGRAFVLFTSYYAMNDAYEQVSSLLPDTEIRMLKQGTDTRHNLLNRFRREQPAALFATDSFWEGVDVIGEALESIIIARLPFKVPTVPIEVARREAIDQAGGNSFTDYTVPQAVIKFKQGFGRLIRHKNDRGTVLILDNRIVSKRYGRIFLESLPECGVATGADTDVFEAFTKFYAAEE